MPLEDARIVCENHYKDTFKPVNEILTRLDKLEKRLADLDKMLDKKVVWHTDLEWLDYGALMYKFMARDGDEHTYYLKQHYMFAALYTPFYNHVPLANSTFIEIS